MKLTLLALAFLLLSACVPANTPNELAAVAAVRQTQESGAVATQAAAFPITQSFEQQEFNRHATETARPPAETSTAVANLQAVATLDAAKTQSARYALAYQTSISVTLEALVRLQSDTQARIAENNRAIAEETYRANAMQWVFYGCAGAVALFLFGAALIALYYFQKGAVTVHQVAERWAWDKVEQDHAKKLFELGFTPSSAGPVRISAPALAEQHLEKYSHVQLWRTACSKLVAQGVIAGQGGAKHPFSETTLSQFVSRPDTAGVWVDGYRKISKVLQDNGVWFSPGPRIAPEWGQGWNWDRFSREFDLTPLHHLPEGNPPDVKTPAWSFAEAA